MKDKGIDSKSEIQKFINICRSYCSFIELERVISTDKYLALLQKLLIELYAQGLNLKVEDLKSDIDFEEKISDGKIDTIKGQLNKVIGEHQYYRAIFDPTENIYGDVSPFIGDLIDDVIDVYKDIKCQLIIFDLDTKESIEYAIWGMRFDFWNHWSNHAIDAIRTIHYVIEKNKV